MIPHPRLKQVSRAGAAGRAAVRSPAGVMRKAGVEIVDLGIAGRPRVEVVSAPGNEGELGSGPGLTGRCRMRGTRSGDGSRRRSPRPSFPGGAERGDREGPTGCRGYAGCARGAVPGGAAVRRRRVRPKHGSRTAPRSRRPRSHRTARRSRESSLVRALRRTRRARPT